MLGEKCGVFGVSSLPNAIETTVIALHIVQHRGQESVGVSVVNNNTMTTRLKEGLVKVNFSEADSVKGLEGDSAIGHTRYSTTQSKSPLLDAQPIEMTLPNFSDMKVAIAHNGQLLDYEKLKKELVNQGAKFKTDSDTEIILQLLAKEDESDITKAIFNVLKKVKGGFAIVILLEDGTLYAARDEIGIRPLVLGKKNGSFAVASESCVFNAIDFECVREVEPGELLKIKGDKMESLRFAEKQRVRPCIFELIYFARPDSLFLGKTIYERRKEIGRQLAKESPMKADMVIPIPDSGLPMAIGYSEESGIPFEYGIIRSHYAVRSFIQPKQTLRQKAILFKHNPNIDLLKGKDIILIDDSLVRGTTIKKLIALIRKTDVKSINVKIGSPMLKHKDIYGIDIPSESELIANLKTLDEIKKEINADTLTYLSIDGIYRAAGFESRDDKNPQMTDHYFTGDYPIR
ncbi:MAG: amidophosphoribosyltransferase [Candidatus Campbellbacteria bacterium]|nr:amidophosphoribosyltransferase [Candidatus Campbellbacteria bacterium]